MQVGPKKTKGLSRPRSLTRRSNEPTQMHCKSVPSRALAQSQMSTTVSSRMVDMTPSPCRRSATTRASTSTLPTPSMTLSKVEENQPYYYDQLVAPSSGDSGLFKAWKVSASKIELELCAAGSNTVPVYCWLLPISSDDSTLPTFPPNLDEYPRAKRCTLTPGGGSQTAQKMSNYLPIYTHESITWNDWNSNDFEYQGGFSSGPQKVPYWYIICKPADGATTSQVFMRAKLTYYTELSERNQEIDYSK